MLEGTVTDASGNAALHIPAGALPPGVSLADVQIRDVQEGNGFRVGGTLVRVEGADVLAAHELEPHGALLRVPVGVTVTTDLVGSGLPLPLHLVGGGLGGGFGLRPEPGTDRAAIVNIDTQSGEAAITTDLESFSSFVLLGVTTVDVVTPEFRQSSPSAFGFFNLIEFREIETIPDVTFSADVNGAPESVTVRTRAVGEWELSGFYSGRGPIKPVFRDRALQAPAPTAIEVGTGFVVTVPLESGKFRCTGLGPFTVVYTARLRWALEHTTVQNGVESEPVTESGTLILSVLIPGVCTP